jgi:hypothetical protein
METALEKTPPDLAFGSYQEHTARYSAAEVAGRSRYHKNPISSPYRVRSPESHLFRQPSQLA